MSEPRDDEEHDEPEEDEPQPPLCPICGTELADVGWLGAVRALGWWFVALVPVLFLAGLILKRDEFHLAAGAALLAGVLLSGLRSAWACAHCGKHYAHEPEGQGREVFGEEECDVPTDEGKAG